MTVGLFLVGLILFTKNCFSTSSPVGRASLVAQMVRNLPAMQETLVRSLGWEDSGGEGNRYPLQYSCLENPMDCIVHRVPKSWTRLSDFHFTSITIP